MRYSRTLAAAVVLLLVLGKCQPTACQTSISQLVNGEGLTGLNTPGLTGKPLIISKGTWDCVEMGKPLESFDHTSSQQKGSNTSHPTPPCSLYLSFQPLLVVPPLPYLACERQGFRGVRGKQPNPASRLKRRPLSGHFGGKFGKQPAAGSSAKVVGARLGRQSANSMDGPVRVPNFNLELLNLGEGIMRHFSGSIHLSPSTTVHCKLPG